MLETGGEGPAGGVAGAGGRAVDSATRASDCGTSQICLSGIVNCITSDSNGVVHNNLFICQGISIEYSTTQTVLSLTFSLVHPRQQNEGTSQQIAQIKLIVCIYRLIAWYDSQILRYECRQDSGNAECCI